MSSNKKGGVRTAVSENISSREEEREELLGLNDRLEAYGECAHVVCTWGRASADFAACAPVSNLSRSSPLVAACLFQKK